MSRTEVREADISGSETAARARTHHVLAFTRFIRLTGCTILHYVGYTTVKWTTRDRRAKREVAVRWTSRWFRSCMRIIGIQPRVRGGLPEGGVLLTPNHLGYLDIAAIGAVCETVFVSKSDVESWPIMGHLFKYSEHIGVSRGKTRAVRVANERIQERLEDGLRVCVFLEGTSSGGGEVLPFHASLVQPAIDAEARVVPVAMRWTADDPAIDVAEDVAYWKDHTLAPHLWRVLGLNGVQVDMTFGDPMDAADLDRKRLAEEAREAVVSLLEEAGGGQ